MFKNSSENYRSRKSRGLQANVFYGNDGIDIAFQREKISWKEHQMLLAIIEKMA